VNCAVTHLPAWKIRRYARGFSLVELSVVLVILAVITAAITTGGDLMRHAKTQRLYADFIFGWSNAFTQYTVATKVVPGDDLRTPQNRIPGQLCNTPGTPNLIDVMLAQGITLPTGRGVGQEDRYVYQDRNGQPHELQICYMTVPWAVAGAAAGAYVTRDRHVMRITGLTVELASQLDVFIDGRADARFGRFRLLGQAASLTAVGAEWVAAPLAPSNPEDFIVEVQALMEM